MKNYLKKIKRHFKKRKKIYFYLFAWPLSLLVTLFATDIYKEKYPDEISSLIYQKVESNIEITDKIFSQNKIESKKILLFLDKLKSNLYNNTALEVNFEQVFLPLKDKEILLKLLCESEMRIKEFVLFNNLFEDNNLDIEYMLEKIVTDINNSKKLMKKNNISIYKNHNIYFVFDKNDLKNISINIKQILKGEKKISEYFLKFLASELKKNQSKIKKLEKEQIELFKKLKK